MTGNQRDAVLDAVSGDGADEPPVAIFTQSATLGQMDRIGVHWPEAHSDSEKMASLGAAQADLFGFPTVRVPFSVTAEAQAIGCGILPGTSVSQPTVVPGKYSLDPMDGSSVGLEMLPDMDDFLKGAGVSTVIDAVSILRKSHPDHAVVAGVTGMLTCMSQFLGAEPLVMGTLMCPDTILEWSDRLSRLLSGYVQLLSENGADIVMLGEAAASPDMIDPSMFGRLAGNGIKRVFSRCGSATCLHICGHALPIIEDMAATGADSLSIENVVDPAEARSKVGGRVALVGNVGPVDPLLTGTEGDVIDAAGKAEADGFDVIAPGCGVAPMTPDGNMLALASYRSRR